jgi:hypothetical protein
MSVDPTPDFDLSTPEGLHEFYAECRELPVSGVQFVAELPDEYAVSAECQICQSDTKAAFIIEHVSMETRVHADCCPDHAAEVVRGLGGRFSGTRIDDKRVSESQQVQLMTEWQIADTGGDDQ